MLHYCLNLDWRNQTSTVPIWTETAVSQKLGCFLPSHLVQLMEMHGCRPQAADINSCTQFASLQNTNTHSLLHVEIPVQSFKVWRFEIWNQRLSSDVVWKFYILYTLRAELSLFLFTAPVHMALLPRFSAMVWAVWLPHKNGRRNHFSILYNIW